VTNSQQITIFSRKAQKLQGNSIKKVEEIIGMDIEDIYIDYKKRDKETDPFEVLIKEIKTSPENKKKIKYMDRMKWGSAIRKYKEFYYDQEE